MVHISRREASSAPEVNGEGCGMVPAGAKRRTCIARRPVRFAILALTSGPSTRTLGAVDVAGRPSKSWVAKYTCSPCMLWAAVQL